MARLDVVRVFVGSDGGGGNLLGVVVRGSEVPDHRRQQLAHKLGFSETVFLDDATRGTVRIFTPAAELPFAGHPMVGTAWLLGQSGTPIDVLRPPAGDVRVLHEPDKTWIVARPEWAPQRRVEQLASGAEVDALSTRECNTFDLYAWAWLDEAAGIVRARYFAPGLGIAEDEATGSAAVFLGGLVGRAIVIKQGVGSAIFVEPGDDGSVAVGGRVEPVEVREVS